MLSYTVLVLGQILAFYPLEDLKLNCFRDDHEGSLSKWQLKNICYHHTDAHKIVAVVLSCWTLIILDTTRSVDHHCILDLPTTFLAVATKLKCRCLPLPILKQPARQMGLKGRKWQEEKHLISPQNWDRGRAWKNKAKHK